MKHLGEAQTCYLIVSRPEFNESFWISDDRDAADYARARGIVTRDTMDLVSEGIQDDCCKRDEGFKLLHCIAQAGRVIRLPAHPAQL
ncbi:hypothetical protein [Nonomuraea sp. NPDC049158]|uniref:hypothetical protein n=1 Tax=Nonomuraea sp. NPDC049158 TaxID=3155649 RepID=UPI0033DB7C34